MMFYYTHNDTLRDSKLLFSCLGENDLASKYHGLFYFDRYIFFNAIACIKEEGKQTLPGYTKLP